MQQTEVLQQVTDVSFKVTTGGLDISFINGRVKQRSHISHDVFRSWSYVEGYWNGDKPYHIFLQDLRRPVIESFITDKLKGQQHG